MEDLSILNNRKALEEFLMDIEVLDQIEKRISNFNAFETMGIIHAEIRHSNVLSWLLTPLENHGLGDYVVRKIIQSVTYNSVNEHTRKNYDPLKISLIDYYDFEVRREWKNIDILLVSEVNKFVIAVENKVWSNESDHQLKKYYNIVHDEYKNYEKLFIYLTPLGEDSSDPETWQSLNYSTVNQIIEKAVDFNNESISEPVRLFINQYIETVRRYIVGDNELEKVCRQIYYKHKKALDLIFEYKPDIYSDISNDLQELIKSTPSLILDTSGKTYIRFTTEQLERRFERNGNGWTASKRLLLFEFQNKGNKLDLKLIIGPGDDESRKEIYEIASNNKDVFRGRTRKLSTQYAQVFSREFLPKFFDDELDYEKIQNQINLRFKRFMENDLVKIHEALMKSNDT
ncbi:PDDEXK-like family protein [Oceanobacillus sp. CAU 1775]